MRSAGSSLWIQDTAAVVRGCIIIDPFVPPSGVVAGASIARLVVLRSVSSWIQPVC